MTDDSRKAERQKALLALALAARHEPQGPGQAGISAEELAAFAEGRLDDPAEKARVLRALAHDPVAWRAWTALRHAPSSEVVRTSPTTMAVEPWHVRLRLWISSHLLVAVPSALAVVLGITFTTQSYFQTSSEQPGVTPGVGISEIAVDQLPDRELVAAAWKLLLPTLRNALPTKSPGLSVSDPRTEAFESGIRDAAVAFDLDKAALNPGPADPCTDATCLELREWGQQFGVWALRMTAACESLDPAVQSLKPAASERDRLSERQLLWRTEKRLPKGLGPLPEAADGEGLCRYARSLTFRALAAN